MSAGWSKTVVESPTNGRNVQREPHRTSSFEAVSFVGSSTSLCDI